MLNDILQVIISLLLITLLGIYAYSTYNKDVQDMIKEMTTPISVKKRVDVFKGVFSCNATGAYNTRDEISGNFLDIRPSINQNGGAEYSYNFWLYIPEISGIAADQQLANMKSYVLFVKGSKQKVAYNSPYNCDNFKNNNIWYLVKNPLVKVVVNNSHKITSVVVEFNSITFPDAIHASPDQPTCSSPDIHIQQQNSIGIHGIDERGTLANKWIMITIVCKETNPSADILFQNKAVVSLYLNGFEYLNRNAYVDYSGSVSSTAMRHNIGNLYINPDNVGKEILKFANLSYFNYAITKDEVLTLYKEGFTKAPAPIPQETSMGPLDYNTSGIDYEESKDIKPY